jgi:hypothetical protein
LGLQLKPSHTAIKQERGLGGAMTIDGKSGGEYTSFMDIIIEFNQAAFTHHIEEADIRFAISTARYDAMIDEDESDNKHLIIGFDRNAKMLEIMYNRLV